MFWQRPDGLIVPLWGVENPYKPVKEGSSYRFPTTIYTIWIDPAYKQRRDTAGVDLYTRIKEGAINVGTVSAIAFREVPYAQAKWRFHFGDIPTVMRMSHSGHPGNTPNSCYYAISKDGHDLYSGGLLKDIYGNKPIGSVHAIRFPWHAWLCSMGWKPQGHFSDDHFFIPPPVAGQPLNQSSGAMRNPNLSGPILWTTADYQRWGTKAGFDTREIGWLQVKGTCWIWRDR